jgi:hypothetical protein
MTIITNGKTYSRILSSYANVMQKHIHKWFLFFICSIDLTTDFPEKSQVNELS